MFLHEEVIINSNDDIGSEYEIHSIMWRVTYNIAKEIQEQEDQEILRILNGLSI